MNIFDGNNVMRRAMENGLMAFAPKLTLRQRYEAVRYGDIWVWDGRHHNDRRRSVYPPYKMNRTPTPEDIYSQINLFKDVLKHSNAIQIEVEGWEADDVIGTLVRKYNTNITVHTNDMDYGQLAHLPGVKLSGVNMKGVPSNRIALYKALNGDTSDNIAGIPGLGPKRWLELEPYWDEIQSGIVAGDLAALARVPFKPAILRWLAEPGNIELLQAMLYVTHFENVPADELNGGVTEGVLNRQAADQMLGRFFL